MIERKNDFTYLNNIVFILQIGMPWQIDDLFTLPLAL